jgi:hypothetical protein
MGSPLADKGRERHRGDRDAAYFGRPVARLEASCAAADGIVADTAWAECREITSVSRAVRGPPQAPRQVRQFV